MANFPSVTAAGAFESPAVQNEIKTLAEQAVAARLAALEHKSSVDIPLTAEWRTDLSSEVTAYRTGNVVTVSAWRLAVNSGVTGDVIAYSLPPGYRMPPLTNIYGLADGRGATVSVAENTVRVLDPSGSVAHHSFTFVTLDDPPSQ